MIWRFLKGKQVSTGVAVEAEVEPQGVPIAPQLGSVQAMGEQVSLEVEQADTLVETPELEAPIEDVAEVLRERVPRQRRIPVGVRNVRPVLVPALRKRALLYRVAAEARAHGKREEACELWRAYLLLCPDDAEAHYEYGRLRMTLDDLPGAKLSFERTIRLNPEDMYALGALAFIARETGLPEEAVRLYEEALKVDAESLDMLFELRDLLNQLGDKDGLDDVLSRIEALAESD